MANECRNVRHDAGLVTPARRTASFTARWMTDSCRWCLWRTRCERRRSVTKLETPIATPTGCRTWAFAGEGVRQRSPAQAARQVLRVLLAHPLKMHLQRRLDGRREHGHAVFPALAVADGNFVALQVDVFDPQAQAFQQSKPGARSVRFFCTNWT